MRFFPLFLRPSLGIVLLAALSAGCATRPPASDPEALAYYKEINDPLEPTNRVIHGFNQGLQKALLRPMAKGYKAVIPAPARKGIGNALRNVRGPVIFANDLMQGEGKRAGDTLARFVINSTLGIAGLFDVAARMGIERHDEDFGQTLAVWGVGEGAYLELPVLGPSNVRDGIGLGVDILLDPLFWILRSENLNYVNYIRRGVEGIDLLATNLDEIEDLERSSLDYYAALRSAYRQDREAEIRNGAEDLEVPDYLFDDFDEYYDEETVGEEPPADETAEPQEDDIETEDTAKEPPPDEEPAPEQPPDEGE